MALIILTPVNLNIRNKLCVRDKTDKNQDLLQQRRKPKNARIVERDPTDKSKNCCKTDENEGLLTETGLTKSKIYCTRQG